MGNEVEEEVFQSSQNAISRFIAAHGGNVKYEEMQVKIYLSDEEVYSKKLRVSIEIDSNESCVWLFGDKQFDKDYFTEYKNRYQVFSSDRTTLYISGVDKHKNAITISVSAA